MKLRHIFMLDRTAKGIPLWMYYVRSVLQIIEGILTLFSLPFHNQFGFSIDWSGYMLRQMAKKRKRSE